MQTVAETPTFTRQADAILTPEEKDDVINLLAASPQIGDEIPGTGGVRKVRVGAKGKGKSKGARVIYYWYSEDAPVYALLAYPKNVKIDLSTDEKKAVAAFARAIKAAERSKV